MGPLVTRCPPHLLHRVNSPVPVPGQLSCAPSSACQRPWRPHAAPPSWHRVATPSRPSSRPPSGSRPARCCSPPYSCSAAAARRWPQATWCWAARFSARAVVRACACASLAAPSPLLHCSPPRLLRFWRRSGVPRRWKQRGGCFQDATQGGDQPVSADSRRQRPYRSSNYLPGKASLQLKVSRTAREHDAASRR